MFDSSHHGGIATAVGVNSVASANLRSTARGACRGLRAVPKGYIGFQGGNRRRRRVAALYDARLVRIQSGRCDRIDCRGVRRNRVARIERQHLATDDGRNERRRGAPFGSDQQDRPSSGW